MTNILHRNFIKGGAVFLRRFPPRLTQRSLHVGEHFRPGSLSEIQLTTPVRLAGRKYLASSHSAAGFPSFLSGPRENYPLLLKAVNGKGATLSLWGKRSREVIDEAYAKYKKDGTAVAILFRGMPITGESSFSEWVNSLGYKPFSYVGGIAPRSEIETNVAEGTRYSKEMSIETHSEMAYTTNYPKIFTIASFKTARSGGETAICDVREVLSKLDSDFVDKCARKNIRYWHFLKDVNQEGEGTSWQEQFQTNDQADVEVYLNEKGFTFTWEEGNLSFWSVSTPFIFDPRDGKRLWFNQLAAMHSSYFVESPYSMAVDSPSNKFSFHTTYGDGEEFEREMIDHVRCVKWESAVGFQWQDGDVLFLDQLIVQHSRLSFDGERKIGISLLTY